MIEKYKKYLLKDGRSGWAVDILDNGEACIFELDKKGLDDRIITIRSNEIEKNLN